MSVSEATNGTAEAQNGAKLEGTITEGMLIKRRRS